MATVQVGSVWPSGSTLTITGQATTGQAITGGAFGAAFGTPSVRTIWYQAVGGVSTAQAFGALTFTQVVAVHPIGLGSAQLFGAVTIRVGGQATQVGGVASAAAFGTPKLNQQFIVAGLGSAQQFGVSLRLNQLVHVAGFYPYDYYIPSITGEVICGDGHLVGGAGGTATQFGRPTILARITVPVGGVGSAQQFGQVKIVQVVHPPGLDSAQAFGSRLGWILGVWGLDSAQAFGKPRVFKVWLHEETCSDLDLSAASCSDLDLVEEVCRSSIGGAILNTFRCGDGTRIGQSSFLDPLPSELDLDLDALSCLADDLQPAGCE